MSQLLELQSVIDREIPVCKALGIRVVTRDAAQLSAAGLSLSMPLEQNRNHQGTAFAGSLNALCTIAGWGTTWLELEELVASGAAGPVAPGGIVIRRSSIKYNAPVSESVITATCVPPGDDRREHFSGMLAAKGQTKLDLQVEIQNPAGGDRPAVELTGVYVVLPAEGGEK